MDKDPKIKLIKQFVELDWPQRLVVLGFAASLFGVGWFLHDKYSEYKFQKISLENAQLNARIDRLVEQSPGKDETIIKVSEYNNLSTRPVACEPTTVGATKVNNNQLVVDKSYLTELKNRPAACPIVPSVSTTASLVDSDRTCLDRGDPFEIAAQFEDYDDRANLKVFRDHFEYKWVCEPGWVVEIVQEPQQNRDYYWEIETRYREENLFGTRVLIKLKDGTKLPTWMKIGNKVRVAGKVVQAATYGLTLVEASAENVE